MENDAPFYLVDREWLEAKRLSFSVLVEERLCPVCRDRFRNGGLASEEEVVSCLREHCSTREDYLNPRLPLLELAFRLLLASPGPLSMEDVQKRLQLLVAKGPYHKDTSREALERLLDRDTYYGIRRLDATGR